jgi:hypothetical protein
LTVSCNASSSPAPPPQDDSECNDVECAPEKEVPTNRLAPLLLFLFFFLSGDLAATDCVRGWVDREPERGVAGGGEDPGGGHFPSQEEGVDGPRREGHRRPDQHLLRRGTYLLLSALASFPTS